MTKTIFVPFALGVLAISKNKWHVVYILVGGMYAMTALWKTGYIRIDTEKNANDNDKSDNGKVSGSVLNKSSVGDSNCSSRGEDATGT
eukprot:13011612-Ditylum_brightwellii.AAC.1